MSSVGARRCVSKALLELRRSVSTCISGATRGHRPGGWTIPRSRGGGAAHRARCTAPRSREPQTSHPGGGSPGAAQSIRGRGEYFMTLHYVHAHGKFLHIKVIKSCFFF